MLTPAAVQQLVDADWMQAGGVIGAALLAVAMVGLQLYRTQKRERQRDRQFIDVILALAREARKLFDDGAVAYSANDFWPSPHFIALMVKEGRELRSALFALPLELAPDSGLIEPLLALRGCLADIDDILTVAEPVEAVTAFKELHHQADTAIVKIEAVRKLLFEKPRRPLRRRAEKGMPTTTVDQYAVFTFPEEIYLEPDGVDFEALVNNQSVRCTISYEELDRLAAAKNAADSELDKDYAMLFRREREAIRNAAEKLIRAGARSPVEVRFKDIEMRSARPRLTLEIGGPVRRVEA